MISNTITSVQALTNGVTRAFSFPNKIFQAQDLVLTLIANQGTTSEIDYGFTYIGNSQFRNLGLGFTVTLSNVDADTGPLATFNNAPATGYVLDMRSNVGEVQSTSIKNQGQFLPDLHEEFFDRITREVQDLRRLTYQFGIHGPDTEVTPWPALPGPAVRANTTQGYDANGLPSLSLIPATAFTQAIFNAFLSTAPTGGLRTAAEAAAGVTPVNYLYPPLYVDRYGNNIGPGTTDMSAAFSAACKVAKTSGGTVRYGATAPYLLTSPIDCTQAAGSTQFGFSIVQDANFTASTSNPPAYPSILAKHTGHVFDCSGALGIDFDRMTIGTDGTTFPKTCFFLARNSAGSSQIHRFTKCMVYGKFSDSVVYNYGSEDEQYVGCQFFNVATTPGTKVIRWTRNNISSLSSTFITIATGDQSCLDHQVIGGQFFNQSSDAAADVFYIEGDCDSIKIYAPWVMCGVPGVAGGRSIVYADMTNSPPNFVSIYNLETEHAGGGAQQNKYGIVFSNDAKTPTGWIVDGGIWDNQTFAIAALGTNPTIDNLYVRSISESVGHGISVPGTLQNSNIQNPGKLVVGTSSRNVLIGFQTNMTITTRSNDVIIDAFTGALTTAGGIGVWGNNPVGQTTGFGSPTGNAVIANFPGATATLVQTSNTVAEILAIMKAIGFIGT